MFFFYQEKFLEVRADYRFHMYLKFLYGKEVSAMSGGLEMFISHAKPSLSYHKETSERFI